MVFHQVLRLRNLCSLITYLHLLHWKQTKIIKRRKAHADEKELFESYKNK